MSSSGRVTNRRMNEKIKLKTWDTANKDDADALVAETAKIKEQIKLKLHEKLLEVDKKLSEVDKKLIKKKEQIEKLKKKIMNYFEAAKMDDARLSASEEARTLWETGQGTLTYAAGDELVRQRKKVAKNIKTLNSMIKRGRELKATYKKLEEEYKKHEEEKFRKILPKLEPSRAAAWEASDAREESIRQEKNHALSWDALGSTRADMDFLSMINAMERAERRPDIVEAEAALVPTNEPIAVSLDAPVATRAPVLGSVVATPLTMTDTAREALSRKRTTKAVDVRLVEGGKKSRKKKKSRGKKRTQKKKKVRKKKQTRRKKQTRKRRKSSTYSLPIGDMLETFGEDDAVLL